MSVGPQNKSEGSKRDLAEIELAHISSRENDGSSWYAHEGNQRATDNGDMMTVSAAQSHDLEPPENAVEDSRPTRRYQTLLLLCGFLMIFQVIGINSVYGVFQVSVVSKAQIFFR